MDQSWKHVAIGFKRAITIFRTSNHPFAFTVKRYPSNVACVTFEGEHGGRIRGFDVVELDGMMARGGEEPLVG